MIGRHLQSRYQIESELGRGGMGVVYKAQDKLLERPVAIKILGASSLSTEGRSRMLLEAQAAAKISHQNVVTIYDVGEEVNEGAHENSSYIVMELIVGQMLRDVGFNDIRRTVEIARQICAALSIAHTHNIVHRDLKPENILVTSAGVVKLTDFGLAQILGGVRITQEGAVMGTLSYLAPEIILGREASPQTDLYSFGIVLYEMLAGRTPFTGDSPTAILSQHLHAPVVPPSTYNRLVSPAADNLILHLLRKEPTDRPLSAAAVAERLEYWRDPHPPNLESMPQPELSRLARGRLVGRGGEFSKAAELWQRARAGENQLLLVSGEPGIGKSRFAQELLTYAEINDGLILSGRCYHYGSLPFAPLKEVIQAALDDHKDIALPSDVMADLLTLAPEYRRNYPALPASQILDLEASQQRLFESITTLCRVITERRTLLLFLDDLHWADSGSIGFLRHLAHRSSGWPMLIVVTYREIELTEKRPARVVLRDLELDGLTRRIKLKRLDLAQTRALLETLFAGQLAPELVEVIYQETEGNPFFVEEVSRTLVENGELTFTEGHWFRSGSSRMQIPESIQLAIESRLEHLPAEQIAILQWAALLGRHFEFNMLMTVSDLAEEMVIDGLEKAQALQLIKEEPAPRKRKYGLQFFFSHALIHSVLLTSLSSLRRMRMQQNVAEKLEAAYPDRVEELALLLGNYYGQAGKLDKAISYYLLGGDVARKMFAYAEAIDAYQQALIPLREQNDYDLTARTLMKLGLMFHNNHNFELARKAYDEAFDLQNKGVNSRQPSLERLPEAPHAYRDHKVEPSSLDPVLAASSDIESFVQLLFSGLVFRTPGGEIMPDIAWRWDMLDGGTHYIFHLRDDVFWTDNRPVTAADFEFAWKRLLHPRYGQSPALLFYDIVGARAFNQGESSNEETIGVFAENLLTLHVRLIEPVSHFIQILSQGSTFPVPRHQVLENPEWANPDQIVCNGAFQIKGWTTGQESILERNANYHRPYQGNVKEIYTSFRDPSLMPELYAAGDLDVLTINLLDHESQLKVMRRFASDYSSVPSPFLDYYWVDVNRSPMDNKFVRLALARAVDRRQLVDTATRGLYYPATGGLVPPGIPGHVSGIATPADPDEARRLLAQAGYPSGKDLPPLEIITSFIPNLKAMTAELARQWWTVLGIRVEVINMPSGQFRQRWLEAPPHAWMLGWTADYPDPYSFLNDASWRPIGGWRHETYDQLIAAAWSCPDNQKRLSLYAQAEQILLEEAPALPLAYPRIHLLIKPWIKNWQLVGTYDPFFPNVVIEAH